MRRSCAAVLCAILFSCIFTCASAQTVSCPEARLSLTVPDSWVSVPLTGQDDPDLRLLLDGGDLTLSVYTADSGSDTFQVFTGDETESYSLVLSGVKADCVAGRNAEGYYRIYTWLDKRTQVQFYFLVTGPEAAARDVIDEIMSSLLFD